MRALPAPLLLLVSLLVGSSTGQLRAQDATFKQVSPEGDLGSSIVGIVQDQQGFLWVAAGNNTYAGSGLYKYDGYRTTIYRHDAADSTSLSHEGLTCLYVDREGTLWVGTWGGLNRFDPVEERFIRYRSDSDDPGSLSHDVVTAILEDREGTLWVGTHEGLNRLDRETGTFTHYRQDPDDPSTLSYDRVWALYEDSRDVLWVGTGSTFDDSSAAGGLNRFDRRTGTFVRYVHDPKNPASLISNRVFALFEDSKGRFWVGTQGNVLHRMDRTSGTFERYGIDPKDSERLSRPENASVSSSCPSDCRRITSITEDHSGTLWIGTFGEGLLQYDPETGGIRRHVTHPGNPTSLGIWTIYQSRDETLWVGTQAGLSKQVAPRPALPRHDLPGWNGRVYSVMEDQSGMVWLATQFGGLYRFDRASGSLTNYRHDPRDPTSVGRGSVDVVYEDREGKTWIGTHGGLSLFDPDTEAFIRFEHDSADSASLSANIVHEIYEDRSGRLWIGTTGGLNLFDRRTGSFTRYLDDPQSLKGSNVRDIAEDREGSLWVATDRGLHVLHEGTGNTDHYRHEPGLPNSLRSNDVMALREDRNGGLWIGTDEGLDRFEPALGAFTHFTPTNSGISIGIVSSIVTDDRGQIWIARHAAPPLLRLDPQQRTVRIYGEDMPRRNLAGTDDAIFASTKGELFVGSVNGFYAFFPDVLDRLANLNPPEVVLTGFRILNEAAEQEDGSPISGPLDGAEVVTLAHDQDVFSFEYVGLHFADPSRNRYMHILEGYDEAWRDVGTQRTARYYKVPPGKYVFRAKAANYDGVWNEEGASIRVVVLPPWWRMWWAYMLYGIFALGGVGAAAYVQKMRIVRSERARSTTRELEHAREVESMNEKLRVHERQLEERNAQLIKQKGHLLELDAHKSRFFANLSHEFRTPLTLLLGPLKDLLDGHHGPLEQPLHRSLLLMERSARRLHRLINQLLDLSKLESGAMPLHTRRLDVIPILQEIVLAFSARAEREQTTLSFVAERESLIATFDPDKLEKVVCNLLSNAFTFTSSGGKVRLEVEAANGSMVIWVKDTGRGIPKEALGHVFDRFYQVDGSTVREHEGTGIGLALTKELVELHGGSIEVESAVGFGTTFTVRLPVDAGIDEHKPYAPQSGERNMLVEAEAPEPIADEPSSGPADAPMILVVEDNPDLRVYLRKHLESTYRVREAGNGEEGLELARKYQPDLIICDVMMPRMDGYSLCQEVKLDPELSHIPVVLLTAKADLESKLEGIERGADDYLYKPFSAEELLARMENLIEMRRTLRRRFSDEVLLSPSEVVVPSREAAFLEEVRDVIESRMGSTNFSVDELAAGVGLSARQLQRRLRKGAGMSAAGYIRLMRLERAAQLLAQDAGTVSEIAYAVGFKNARHFSQLFHQVFGMPPSEYVG